MANKKPCIYINKQPQYEIQRDGYSIMVPEHNGKQKEDKQFKNIMILYFVEKQTYDKIAELLKISKHTIVNAMRRAKKLLPPIAEIIKKRKANKA